MQLNPSLTPAQLAAATSNGQWKVARHLSLVSDHLKMVTEGRLDRLQINMPCRHGKTMLAVRYWPLYHFLAHPSDRILYAAKSEAAAEEESGLARDVVAEFGPLFGLSIRKSKSSANDWHLVDASGRPTGGSFKALGRCSATHGRGANVVLLDDLFGSLSDVCSAANRDSVWRWLTSSVRTRLTPSGKIVSIGTPLHPDDHFGRWQRAEELGGEKWVRLKLPAYSAGAELDPLRRPVGECLWPEVFPPAELEKIRTQFEASGNARDWHSQYLLEPLSGDGLSAFTSAMLPTSMFFPDLPANPIYKLIAVDPSQGRSSRSDYFAVVVIYVTRDATGMQHYWIDCCFAQRSPIPIGTAAIVSAAMAHIPNQVVIESNNDQHAIAVDVAQQINEACRKNKVAQIAVAGKESTSGGGKFKPRIKITLGPLLAAGQIHVRFNDGGRLLMSQLRDHPYSSCDDCADAAEMGISIIRRLGM
jgi:hypothetical protein